MSEIKIEKIDAVTAKAFINANESEVQKYEKQSLEYFRKNKQLPGFRKGKAPDALLKSKFGADIEMRTINLFMQDQLEVVHEKSEHGLYDVLKIDLKDKKKDSYRFEVEFANSPYVVLGKLKELSLREDTPLIEEDDVEKDLRSLLRRHAELETRAEGEGSQEGDVVMFERETWENDVPIGEPAPSYCLLGDFQLHRELEEEIMLKQGKVGEEFSVELTQPAPQDDKNSEAAAAHAATTKLIFTIKEIKKLLLPTLDDDFVKKFYPTDETLANLKKRIRTNQENIFRRTNIRRQMSAAVETLLKSSSVYFPQKYLQTKQEEFLREQKLNASQLSEQDLKTLEADILLYHQKSLLNQELLEKSKEQIADFNHEKEFFEYLDNENDAASAVYVKNLYADYKASKKLPDEAFNYLNDALRDFHWFLVFRYFKNTGIVKDGKHVKFSEYMQEEKEAY